VDKLFKRFMPNVDAVYNEKLQLYKNNI